jgi:hypothetical protein
MLVNTLLVKLPGSVLLRAGVILRRNIDDLVGVRPTIVLRVVSSLGGISRHWKGGCRQERVSADCTWLDVRADSLYEGKSAGDDLADRMA